MFTSLPKSTTYGSGVGAEAMFESMTRQQWANYISTFAPLENKLIDTAMSVDAVPNAMRDAQADVESAYASSTASTDRRLRGQGITLDADQQLARTKATGISKALADVRAQSLARDLTTNRQQTILGNPAPNLAGV